MKKKIVIGLLLAQLPFIHAVPVWGQSIDIIKEQQIDDENEASQELLELTNKEDALSVFKKSADGADAQVISVYSYKGYEYSTGWLTANTNIRSYPGFSDNNENVLTVLPKYSEIEYAAYNDEWSVIKYGNSMAYVHSDLISSQKITSTTYYAPHNRIKSYMPYTAITSRSSAQWRLQQSAHDGFFGIRQIDRRFCIAVGSAYTSKIGQYIDLVLENGTIIHCVLADQKADRDTNAENTITEHDGSLVEFIVNSGQLSSKVKRMGDISYATDSWNSMITQVIVYDEVADY